jgi:hypothetical protein
LWLLARDRFEGLWTRFLEQLVGARALADLALCHHVHAAAAIATERCLGCAVTAGHSRMVITVDVEAAVFT